MIKRHDHWVGFTHELSNTNFEVFGYGVLCLGFVLLRKDMNPLSIVEPIDQKIELRLFKSSSSNDRNTTTTTVDDPFEVVSKKFLWSAAIQRTSLMLVVPKLEMRRGSSNKDTWLWMIKVHVLDYYSIGCSQIARPIVLDRERKVCFFAPKCIGKDEPHWAQKGDTISGLVSSDVAFSAFMCRVNTIFVVGWTYILMCAIRYAISKSVYVIYIIILLIFHH